MSKVTIAAAVLAGLAISDRLNELEVRDEKLSTEIGNLASALGAVMAATEAVDLAVTIIAKAQLAEDEDCVMQGLAAVKEQLGDLVADQDKIHEAMFGNMSDEEKMLLQLIAALGGR
ncbi:hypothetical protein ISREJYDI_CDS0083 [Pseudomonas phage UNO-G1W1]|jgi:hypothetical protein|uniref:Uncharacterized protein n=1 Tax=Pseudomonas phage UNO-G1W1 TaxID=3136609 RepID=A0AAX4MW92_9CAUD